MYRSLMEAAQLCILDQVTDFVHFCGLCRQARLPLWRDCFVWEANGSVCEVIHRWSHALATPREHSPQTKMFLFFLKRGFQSTSNSVCWTIDPIFIGLFCDSLMVEMIGPCDNCCILISLLPNLISKCLFYFLVHFIKKLWPHWDVYCQ